MKNTEQILKIIIHLEIWIIGMGINYVIDGNILVGSVIASILGTIFVINLSPRKINR